MVGWRQFGCGCGLFGGVGIFRQKNVGELVEACRGQVGEEAVELGEKNDGKSGFGGAQALGIGEVTRGACETAGSCGGLLEEGNNLFAGCGGILSPQGSAAKGEGQSAQQGHFYSASQKTSYHVNGRSPRLLLAARDQ